MVVDLYTPRGVHEQTRYDSFGLNNSPDNSSIISKNTLPTFSSDAPPPLKSHQQLEEEDNERRKEMESTLQAMQKLQQENELVRPLTTAMKYAVGERVLGLYIDKWYPGVISKINRPPEIQQHDGESGKDFSVRLEEYKQNDAKGQGYTYDVRFDDGDFEKGMLPRKIQRDPTPKEFLG